MHFNSIAREFDSAAKRVVPEKGREGQNQGKIGYGL
jgi:hypothetical protein